MSMELISASLVQLPWSLVRPWTLDQRPSTSLCRAVAQHALAIEREPLRTHRAGGPNPDLVDRLGAGPSVDHDRREGSPGHQRDDDGVAQLEPEDEERHPGQPRDRVQHADDRYPEALE